MDDKRLEQTIQILRDVTLGTEFDGALWLVGGYVRDKILGIKSNSDDIDIVLEGSSEKLADLLNQSGAAEHAPVTYPRFGTAMVTVRGVNVELVTARRESYSAGSRKPDQVEQATIEEDARRRDFTINTLLENLHSGDLQDPLGTGLSDLKAGIVRTPLPASDTFADDPLRMLRAVRFAARFGFQIEPSVWLSIRERANLLTKTVSSERIRDEFNKIVMGKDPAFGLGLLFDSGLLADFAPELTVMYGVTQNEFHCLPVWEHTLAVLNGLVTHCPSASLLLRLSAVLHDCGKPAARTVGADGRIHFYGHQDIGAAISRVFLQRLKYSTSDTTIVADLVALHMRIGEYKPDEWTDAAVRRFIRAAGPLMNWLFDLHRADVSGLGPEFQDLSRAVLLRERIDHLQSKSDALSMDSPLSGAEIMDIVGIKPGPAVGEIKSALTEAVIEGTLSQRDKDEAADLARKLFKSK